MTCRILKLSMVAAIAAGLLLTSLAAGAEARPVSKSAPAEAKLPPAEAKLPPAEAKSPPATPKAPHPALESAAKGEEHSWLCLGRLIELLRSRTAA
jgi:hypothetical protein